MALGDGNTRYFLGDEGKCGPLEQAWPAQMEAILAALGAKTVVRNEGVPGETAADARETFAARSAGAKLCVLGFGMEDIRRPERTMAAYLAEMEDMFRQAREQGVRLIVLGIPWFDKNYAGELVQTRLPKWNAGLSRLCEEAGIPFVDLYRPWGTTRTGGTASGSCRATICPQQASGRWPSWCCPSCCVCCGKSGEQQRNQVPGGAPEQQDGNHTPDQGGFPSAEGGPPGFYVSQPQPHQQRRQNGQQEQQHRVGRPGGGKVQPQQGQTHPRDAAAGTEQARDSMDRAGNGAAAQPHKNSIGEPDPQDQARPQKQPFQTMLCLRSHCR